MPDRIRSRLKFQLNSLSCFSNLTCLELDQVQLMDSSLQGLAQLRRLELVSCDFKNFRDNSFRFISDLQVLVINSPLNCSHLNFHTLTCLEWFDVKYFPLQLKSSSMNHVKVLNVSQSIKESNSGDFIPILISTFSMIRVLNLSQNVLVNFDGALLFGLPALEILIINQSSVKLINLAYDCLTCLDSLSLSHNQLKTVDNVFCKLVNLKSLDLSKNLDLSISTQMFSGLIKLKNLSLQRCQGLATYFSSHSYDLFNQLSNLSSLNISEADLRQLDSECFSYTPNLQRLELSHNSLSDLQTDTFCKLKNLRFLNLSFNGIKRIRNGLFQHLNLLDVLNLSFNFIERLQCENFIGLDNLTKLNIYGNNLDGIKPDVFSSMQCLEEVRISKSLEVNQNELEINYGSTISFLFLE